MECKNLDVFVLTYNRAKYLKTMLESLCMQTATGFNIKVLNNASTDNTLEVIEEVKRKYPNRNIIVITNEKNLGNTGNFIRSRELVENEYTAIFHDDDAIHPQYIQTAMSIFRKNSEIVMISGIKSLLWNIDNYNWSMLNKNYHVYNKNDGIYLALLIQRSIFANCIYKTDIYKKVEYHPEKYGKLHDIMYCLECNKYGSVAIIQGSCMRWRQHIESDSNVFNNGPFPDEVESIIADIKILGKGKHSFLFKPLLWNFAYFLYNWSCLSSYLTWNDFSNRLVARGVFSKFERSIFKRKFFISKLNRLIIKRAKYYRKKVYCAYTERF